MFKRSVQLYAVEGIPLVKAGDDLAGLILAALASAGNHLKDHDVVVIAQKVVSKAEGRSVELAGVTPSPRAIEIAAQAHKDPRIVELILGESNELLRVRPGVIIVEHRLGLVLANAGIDRSNVEGETALLLPLDPDGSAKRIRARIAEKAVAKVGVMIIDSIGRAWRTGTIGTTIGASGISALSDLRGQPDLFGRKLETTEVGAADEVAAAASLVMGQAAEATPVVVVRGIDLSGSGSARDLLRPKSMDLFR
ncbi:coenzyme F420-0:L-glutamate ligase [Rhodopseudomonas sp. NSM]|uniref:coenzyme F420-0:L-glutamate ligase n=1 Tax=Rhodopseudomonas sp. NSM TaxID=3457630 RepID=UPI004036E5AE